MVDYPIRTESAVKHSSVSALPELQGGALDLAQFLQAEWRKYVEMREQALTIELNEVRRQLGKPPISQRKLQAMLNQKCSECGKSMP